MPRAGFLLLWARPIRATRRLSSRRYAGWKPAAGHKIAGSTLFLHFFLGGTMESFTALAMRNFTTFLAGILIASPVAGLRPMRALRSTRTRRPIPGITNIPLFLVSRTAISVKVARKCLAALVVVPVAAASSFTIWD